MFLNVHLGARLLLLCGAAILTAFAQQTAGPDVLLLIDGEKLIGNLKSANGEKVIFVSDLAGEVTVAWSKIQELRSQAKFATLTKDVTLKNREEAAAVTQGTVEMTDQKLAVTTAGQPSRTIPVGNVATVIPEAAFQQALKKQGILDGWNGAAGLGLTLTRSTTDNRTLSAYVAISRLSPSENWLTARNKTALDFNFFSGKASSSGVVSSDFSIFQANAIREHYLSQKRFIFVGANWEHNSNQGLDLMQGYGGGVGAVFYRSERTEFSARAGVGYVHQGFSDPTLNKNIIGSRFNQTFTHTFPRNVTFTETAGFRPAWNHSNAFVTGFIASLSVPVYHRINLSVNSFDSYINDPPPYFKKNSLQVTVGVNYSLR